MSDASAFGFGKFIPGFDFLQNLGKASTPSSGLPPFSHWVAPTVSVEEVEKRIEELKSVQFWLEQNSKALAATVQALEVQKMTLSTLKGMNVNLADMAQAFPFSAAPSAKAGSEPLSAWPMDFSKSAVEPSASAAAGESPQAAEASAKDAAQAGAAQAANMATAVQWWGALTQQFQQIAQQAMQDPAQQQAMLKATQMSTDFAKTAVKTAGDMVRQAVAKTRSAKAAASTAKKAAAPAKTTAAKTPAVKKTAAAKKTTPAGKKTPSVISKAPSVAVKKTTASKTRSR